MTIVYCIICFLLGGGLLYLILKNKLNSAIELDQKTQEENQRIKEDNQILLIEKNKINNQIILLNNQQNLLNNEINNLKEKKQILDNNYKEASQNAEAYCEKAKELAIEKFAQSTEKIANEYQQAEDDYKQEYLKVIQETSQSYADTIAQKQKELEELNSILLEAKQKQDAIIEANKRAEEVKQKEQFYKLNLSDTDKEEIKHLRAVIPYLRSAEPINKVIWKVYYEKPYSDLVGRVVGQNIHTGIYKITNLENGMCYVGQASNLAERIRQHIKRGVGAEAPTRNKLYPAMYEIGPENFTFEVIEECERNQLDAREDYWQEFYQAREYGYSIK